MTLEDRRTGGPEELRAALETVDREQRTGVLEIATAEGTTRIHVRRGHVVGVAQGTSARRWILADYLVDSGVVGQEALVAAKREADKRNEETEEVLVRRNAVSGDVLKRFVDLQAAELLFPLFRHGSLEIRFVEERPRVTRFATPLPIRYVLREGMQQAEQWPTLRQRLGRPSAIYDKDPTVMAELLGYETPDPEDPLPELGANARIVYFFVDGTRTVEGVARASGLTLHATFAAMVELLDAGLIQLVTGHGEDEGGVREGSALPRVVTVLTSLLIVGILSLGALSVTDRLEAIRTADTDEPAASITQEARYRIVDEAIRIYAARHGELPSSLQTLIEEGYLRPDAADDLEALRYRPSDGGYHLERRR